MYIVLSIYFILACLYNNIKRRTNTYTISIIFFLGTLILGLLVRYFNNIILTRAFISCALTALISFWSANNHTFKEDEKKKNKEKV